MAETFRQWTTWRRTHRDGYRMIVILLWLTNLILHLSVGGIGWVAFSAFALGVNFEKLIGDGS